MLQATLLEISANLNYGLNEVKESQIDMRKIHQEVRNEIQKINNYENNEIYFGMRTAIVSSALPGTKKTYSTSTMT